MLKDGINHCSCLQIVFIHSFQNLINNIPEIMKLCSLVAKKQAKIYHRIMFNVKNMTSSPFLFYGHGTHSLLLFIILL